MNKQSKYYRLTPIKGKLGKVTDLVELLYALDTCDCINNGEIGVEELADAFSEIFVVEIKNCYNVLLLSFEMCTFAHVIEVLYQRQR